MADTSVILKWYLEEPDREQALALRAAHAEGTVRLLFLDIVPYEVANVLRYKPGWDASRVSAAVDSLFQLGVEMHIVTPILLARAARLAFAHDIAVYDAAFVAPASARARPR